MMTLNFPPRKPRVELTPEMIEKFATEGLSLAQIANSLGYAYTTIYRRVGESVTLSEAYKRGQKTANDKQLEVL